MHVTHALQRSHTHTHTHLNTYTQFKYSCYLFFKNTTPCGIQNIRTHIHAIKGLALSLSLTHTHTRTPTHSSSIPAAYSSRTPSPFYIPNTSLHTSVSPTRLQHNINNNKVVINDEFESAQGTYFITTQISGSSPAAIHHFLDLFFVAMQDK